MSAAGYVASTFVTGGPKDDERCRARLAQIAVFTIGAVMWPAVLLMTMNKEWRAGEMTRDPFLCVCALGVMAVFAFELSGLANSPAGDITASASSAAHQTREAKSTFLTIVSMVFAFGVLISNIARNNESLRSPRSAQICITAMLLGLAFTVPCVDTEASGEFATCVASSVTKTACFYAVGIFLSGVVLELRHVQRPQS
ncbi:MAG: hypothetical protein ACO38I_09820 [Ilumatobacteraceae bacterium]